MRSKIALVALMGLSACAVGPEHSAPVFPLADRFRVSTAQPTAIPQVVVERWWTQFNDPVLDGLVERALIANTDIAAAEARIGEARGTRASSLAALLPTLDARGGVTNERVSRRGRVQAPGGSEFRVFDQSFDALWEIDLFGGRRRGLQAAQADLQASEADAWANRVTVAAEVVRSYVALRALQERISLSRDTITNQEDAVQLQRRRFRAGLVSELDAAQSEALLADLRAALPGLETSIEERRNALAVLLGEAPERLAIELREPRPIPDPPRVTQLGVPSDLLRRRPDLVRAERRVAAASARIGQQIAEFYPRLSLTGSFGWQARNSADFGTPDARLWSIGPSVRWRLLDFGRVQAAVDGARASEQAALAEWQGTLLRALEEVDSGIARVNGGAAERQRREESVTAQLRARDIARERYRLGLSEFLPVIDAERRANDARDAAIRAREAQADASVRLLKALGGAWAPLGGARQEAEITIGARQR